MHGGSPVVICALGGDFVVCSCTLAFLADVNFFLKRPFLDARI
jgi:hypothetical protein